MTAGVGLETGGGVQVGRREKGVAVWENSGELVVKAVQADNKIMSASAAILDLVFITMISSLVAIMLSLDANSFG